MICKKNELIITYYPFNNCNFTCDYCYRSELKNEYTATTQDINNLIKNLSHNKIKYFKILGGEPLIYPNIEYLLQSLSQANNIETIKFLTNGFLFNKLLYLASTYQNVKFTYSIHPSLSNLNEEILQKLLLPNIKYTLICDFRYKDKLDYYINLLQKYKRSYTLANVYTYDSLNNKYSTLEEFNNLYKKYNKIDTPIINFKGTYCYNNTIYIQSNGQLNYGECHKLKQNFKLSIYNKQYIHIPRKILCSMNIHCTTRCQYTYKENCN